MTDPVGADRAKLILASCAAALRQGLVDLGWLDVDLGPADKAFRIQWGTKRIPDHEPIPPNYMVLSSEDVDSRAMETGSGATFDTYEMYLDFYPEEEQLGKDVSADVRSLLQGKYPDIGFADGGLMVVDLRPSTRTDTPGENLFWVDIDAELVKEVHNAGNPARPELRNWYSVAFYIEDDCP